jgi:hypothetical protein
MLHQAAPQSLKRLPIAVVVHFRCDTRNQPVNNPVSSGSHVAASSHQEEVPVLL